MYWVMFNFDFQPFSMSFEAWEHTLLRNQRENRLGYGQAVVESGLDKD